MDEVGPLCDIELPLVGSTTSVGDTEEAGVAHEEIDALHATPFLLLINARAALPSVPLLVGACRASSIRFRLERCKFIGSDVRAE